jgi:hypothetical protein
MLSPWGEHLVRVKFEDEILRDGQDDTDRASFLRYSNDVADLDGLLPIIA